jgi:hypothetical protein
LHREYEILIYFNVFLSPKNIFFQAPAIQVQQIIIIFTCATQWMKKKDCKMKEKLETAVLINSPALALVFEIINFIR